jgi:capsular exopolysaccharide synthesis family protein
MAKMKREHALNLVKLKILQDNFEKAKGTVLSTAKQFTGDTLELEFKRAKLAQVTKIHDELYSRILAITTEQRAPERVERFKDATLPLRPVELIPWKLVGVGTPLSFLLPFGLAVAWEHLFRRVSSRQQLEGSSRQLTVVGEVTSLPSRKRGVRLDQVVGDRDMQLFEESVDGLRTVISLDSAIENMRVLAVTSAVSREGKTSLATQLAVSIARATGERTLLIDGDMRSPDLHWIFGTELEPGLVDLLKNECDLDEAIETGFSDKLHLLTAGKLNTSPHRLLGSGNFNSLLEKLLESYRHIVIDTPPVLPASESLVLARAADASIVCVRRDYSRLGHVDSACTRMANAGVKVIGAVINGIPVQQYLSRYGAYGYNVNN